MKFGETLATLLTPEWRTQYIDYEKLKILLYTAQEQAPSAEVEGEESLRRYFARFDEKFLVQCEKELTKINTFFSEKLAEAVRKWAGLKSELESYKEMVRKHPTNESNQPRKKSFLAEGSERLDPRRRKSVGGKYLGGGATSTKRNSEDATISGKKRNDFKLAFSEFYLSLVLLQNYQQLNFTGFRKILKKHDKLMSTEVGAEWRAANVDLAAFYTNKQIDIMIRETENIYIEELEGGDRQRAMKRLRVPPLGENQISIWTTFRVGLFAGIVIAEVIAIFIASYYTSKGYPFTWYPKEIAGTNWRVALYMYRGSLLVVMYIVFLSLNTYGWRHHGVNHVLIFELDPRNHLDSREYMEIASQLAVVWCSSFFLFIVSHFSALQIPIYVHPLSIIVFMVAFLFNPFPIFYHRARFWAIKILFRIFTAPFHYVTFADFWLADQLNSMAALFLDFEYLVCFYIFVCPTSWDIPSKIDACESITNLTTALPEITTVTNWTTLVAPTLNPHTNEKADAVCLSHPASYVIRFIVACLPAWFRFAQCLRRYRDTRQAFPHLVNAGKYSTTFMVAMCSTLYSYFYEQESRTTTILLILWVFSCLISSCYTFWWDLRMDWGLMETNGAEDENRFLREEIVYSSSFYYYFGIVEDFVLRFAWTFTVSVTHDKVLKSQVDKDILVSVLALLEIFRRFVWNFFRLENEHLNNCGQFRAVRDISIAPIHESDQMVIEAMMDEEDGVENRRKDKQKRAYGNPDVACPIDMAPALLVQTLELIQHRKKSVPYDKIVKERRESMIALQRQGPAESKSTIPKRRRHSKKQKNQLMVQWGDDDMDEDTVLPPSNEKRAPLMGLWANT